jgi:hypothetical protein
LGSRCFIAADGDDDDVPSSRKASTSTIQADAFLQSTCVVAEDEQMRFELRDLRNTVEANPMSQHTRKIQAFGICANLCIVVAGFDEHPHKRERGDAQR